MLAHTLYSPQGRLIGLIHRRLKWHVAEHNRIVASRASLNEKAREAALASHRWAAVECEAILDGIEPDWGDEREITEKFLELPSEEAVPLGLA